MRAIKVRSNHPGFGMTADQRIEWFGGCVSDHDLCGGRRRAGRYSWPCGCSCHEWIPREGPTVLTTLGTTA